MLTLTVTSFNGKPPAQPASTTFDTSGGTIGRAESNQLVLEDAERTVSRVHAQIVWRNDAYRLIDRGSNPALVNGTPLEPGQEVILRDADQVQIGGYVLHCAVEEADPSTWQNLARSADSPGLPGLPAPTSDDPFADIFGASTGDPHTAHNPAALDDLLRPASAPAAAPPSGEFDLGLDDPAANCSIDELFGLGPAASEAQGRADAAWSAPSGASPIDDPLSAPNTAQEADPFASLTSSARPAAPPPTLPERGSELHSAFPLPRMRPEPPEAVRPPPAAPPSAFAEPPPPPADDHALTEALLRGLNAPGVRLDALTPEFMQTLGVLLREATQGTLDLLAARATTKREMRTDATIIAATGNNPLKFSPDVETALAYLLNPPSRGFMPGAQALSDAYDDLRAHQVGFVAGMRAALDGVFERFEPAKIEARLEQHALLDAILPQLNRRARCWNLFAELYGQLSHEAADDFHALFGKAFVAEYEAQIDRLKKPRS
jgi:type VI secretion system FHA domain protein